MTGIIVDKFKDELFIFADGQVGGQHFILTHNDKKIIKVDEGNMFTMCGDACAIDLVMELFHTNQLTFDKVKDMQCEATVIWANKNVIKLVDFEKEENVTGGISTFKHEALPMFFGSGSAALSGGYYAVLKKFKKREDYIQAMKLVFKAASNRTPTMGELNQVESIKVSKK